MIGGSPDNVRSHAVMSKGQVLQIDSAAALYEQPNLPRCLVAECIGTNDVCEGPVLRSGRHARAMRVRRASCWAPVNGGRNLAPARRQRVAVVRIPLVFPPRKSWKIAASRPANAMAINGRRWHEPILVTAATIMSGRGNRKHDRSRRQNRRRA